MERLIVICVSLFLTFNAAPFLFLITGSYIESFIINGKAQAFLTLSGGAIITILFFVAAMKLGEKLIIKNEN